MKGVWITLGPMIAAAALVLWGGERLSRRVVEERQPADRARLLDFSVALGDELDRLDELFEEHAVRVSGLAEFSLREDLARAAEGLVGIRSIHVFEGNGKRYEVAGKWIAGAARAPEVEMEGSRSILSPERTLVLPRKLGSHAVTSGWLATPDPNHRAYWRMTGSGQLVVFLIDDGELQPLLQDHLRKWMDGPSAPLDEAEELYAVSGPKASWLGAPANLGENAGPAALQIPHRTALGEWQVHAWDRRSQTSGRHVATLWISGGLAAMLIMAGGLLYLERQRSVKLAAERVSFVNRVSHELGTPLTNILLNLDLISRAVGRNPEEAKRRLAMVGEEVRRLARLVANVLTFSRSERDDLKPRVVSCVPDEVIAGVLEQFQPSLERRGIRIEWRSEAHEQVLADPDALSQIVGNLISNVEKYAAGGGWLGMTSTLGEGRLRVRVADRGPGIAVRHEKRIFGAFERIETAVNEGSSGTGLGLSIARDLARRGQGELCLVAATEGAAFELDLPAPLALH